MKERRSKGAPHPTQVQKLTQVSPNVAVCQSPANNRRENNPRKHLQRQRFKEVFASQRETSIGVTPHNNSRGNSPKAQLGEEEVSLTDQQGLLTKQF